MIALMKDCISASMGSLDLGTLRVALDQSMLAQSRVMVLMVNPGTSLV
jgi:hypothetical protein